MNADLSPKVVNMGHNFRGIRYWSYCHQSWRKIRGSRNLVEVLKSLDLYWSKYVTHTEELLSQRIEYRHERTNVLAKTIRFYGYFFHYPIVITVPKSNLLKIVVRPLDRVDSKELLERAVEILTKICRESVLDSDFMLDN